MFLSLLPLSLLATVVHALVNVTLDDTDPSIVYNGVWDPSSEHKSSLDFNGSHTFSSDASGSATLTFTGVAVYYLAPRWPYAVSTEIALDGGSGVVLNLTDPLASTTSPGGSESAQWSVIWSATNLSNTTHRVVVTMAAGGETIVVDGFIYTTDNHSSSTPISSSSASSATATQSSTSPSVLPIRHPTHVDALTIGLGIGLGMAALLCAGAAFYFLFYRRRSKGNRYRDRHQVIYESWGGDLDSDRNFGHPEDKPAVTPFLLGAPARASPPRQTYIHAATASSAPSDADPLLAPFDASSPYRDEPRITASVVSTRLSSEQPESSATSGSGSRSSSSGGPSTRPGTASAVYTPALSEKSRPPREQTATPGPPAYSA